MFIHKTKFGELKHGEHVFLYELDNGSMQVKFSNYGCIITSIKVPDKRGQLGEVVLGFDNFKDYLDDHPYFGTIIGPVANRISNASFELENENYKLDANEGVNHLHGGFSGFDQMLWKEVDVLESKDVLQVKLEFLKPNGMMGYPGDVKVTFTLSLYSDNRLTMNYHADTNKATLLNLTHHDYFNLWDGGQSNVLDHVLQINGSFYTPTFKDKCLTGEINSVDNTNYDFRNRRIIRESITRLKNKTEKSNNFDHNYILEKDNAKAAILQCNNSGRRLEIFTNKPCMQFYIAEHLDGRFSRGNKTFKSMHGLCLEPQFYPDAINQPNFPSNILFPNKIYDYFTTYVFSNLNL